MNWHLLREWLQQPEVRYGLAGVLGAVVNWALEEEPLVLPRVVGNRLELGFVGNLVTCCVAAQVADSCFANALVGGLAGTMILRTLKRRIDSACEEELRRLGGR